MTSPYYQMIVILFSRMNRFVQSPHYFDPESMCAGFCWKWVIERRLAMSSLCPLFQSAMSALEQRIQRINTVLCIPGSVCVIQASSEYICNTWWRILIVLHTVSVYTLLVWANKGMVMIYVCLLCMCDCESRGAVVAPPFQERQNNNCSPTVLKQKGMSDAPFPTNEQSRVTD